MAVTVRSVPPRVLPGMPGVFGRFSPLDWLTACYAISSGAVLLSRWLHQGNWPGTTTPAWLLLAHGLILLLVVLAAEARHRSGPGRSMLAEWYPLFLLTAVYASIGLVNGPRESLGLSHDQMVLHLEGKLFGPWPVDRLGGQDGPSFVTWALGISYLAFFPMVIAAPLVLWLQGKVEHSRRAIFGISLVFFTCYLFFLLFPVAGPAYQWGWPVDQPHDIPVRLVRSLNDRGDSWGSAFPSSHVAASAAAVLLGMTGCRRLGSMLLPIALGILLAVVYFRVHYVLDAAAGLLVAALAAWAVVRTWPITSLSR